MCGHHVALARVGCCKNSCLLLSMLAYNKAAKVVPEHYGVRK
jgi:hypothetical protein